METPGLSPIAAENPNGTKVLILTNQAAEQQVQIALGNQILPITLPADSITTLVW